MTPKERMAIAPQAMPEQNAQERAKNMKEVALGYTAEMAKCEASRCMQCPTKPCMQGCPVAINIPGFLAKAAEGDFAGALKIIKETSLLPAVCGRVCPQEKQCQKFCTMGKLLKDVDKAVAIGRVERFCADLARETNAEAPVACAPKTGKKVAVIGSGPASITCAADCAKAGHDVTMFEAFHKCGGVLVYGIPEFRLPKSIVQKEVDGLKALGVNVATNVVIGRTMSVDDLLEEEGYEAVFIGSGAGLPMFMHIPGEALKGVTLACAKGATVSVDIEKLGAKGAEIGAADGNALTLALVYPEGTTELSLQGLALCTVPKGVAVSVKRPHGYRVVLSSVENDDGTVTWFADVEKTGFAFVVR